MIPDKIYFPADGLPAYIDWDGSPVRTKQAEDSDVCYIRKDSLWKATPEQLEAMECAIIDFEEDGCNTIAGYLKEIYNQIKKL